MTATIDLSNLVPEIVNRSDFGRIMELEAYIQVIADCPQQRQLEVFLQTYGVVKVHNNRKEFKMYNNAVWRLTRLVELLKEDPRLSIADAKVQVQVGVQQ